MPKGTEISPLLATDVPSRTAKAPEVMEPALVTPPLPPLAAAKLSWPFMKSVSPTSRVEATKPPVVLTTPVEEIAIPLGLTRNT